MATSGKRPPGKAGNQAGNKSGNKSGAPSGVNAPSGSGEGAQARKARRAEAVAAMKKAQAARERRSRLLMAGGVVVAILIVAGVGIGIGLTRSPSQAKATTSASTGVVAGVTGVSSAVYDKVGVGAAQTAPHPLTGEPALTKDGKPQVLYVGAEYCPYCAAERWAIAASLSRFGTFKGLGETESSATDVFPRTQTLSFHDATYTSKYLTFTAYETQTNTGKPLDTLTGDDLKTEKKYNYPPYVSGSGGAIPFLDIANKYVSSGATYDAGVLKGMSHAQIAKAMSDPTSKAGKAIDGAANLFTAAICQATNNQPTNVCSSTGVQTALKAMSTSTSSSGS